MLQIEINVNGTTAEELGCGGVDALLTLAESRLPNVTADGIGAWVLGVESPILAISAATVQVQIPISSEMSASVVFEGMTRILSDPELLGNTLLGANSSATVGWDPTGTGTFIAPNPNREEAGASSNIGTVDEDDEPSLVGPIAGAVAAVAVVAGVSYYVWAYLACCGCCGAAAVGASFDRNVCDKCGFKAKSAEALEEH